MKTALERIEEAYKRKISLLGSLVECLKLERENLIHVDVKGLWSLMEEKQRILASIQNTEDEISACRAENPDREFPNGQALRRLKQEIRLLTQEIGARVRENVSFIHETLEFFDEIISIFASGKRADYGYEPARRRQSPSSSLIFESEV